MAGRFSVEAVFKAVDRLTAPVRKMQNRVKKFTRSVNRGFHRLNRTVDKFGRGLKAVGRQAAVVGVVLGALGANIISTGAGFEQAITDVGAVSLQTRKQIEPLEKMALELGRTTKFTSTQAANAMEVMARAGFSMNDTLSATPAVLSAAAASGLEIADVANHVSNVLKGMGLETTEAARVADVLALASARTNSSIGSLGESMKNVASTARQLNIPLEQVVAGVALLQDVGLDASVAGSAFNTMLTKMAAPTTGMQKKMRRLGISFKDSEGNMLPLADVLEQLSKASKKVGGNFDQVAFLAELVGLRGQKAASNLRDLFETGKIKELTAELDKAKGSAEAMARLRMNTFQGSMLLLGSAIDAVKVKIFGLNEGPLKDVVDNLTKWVNANEDLIATRVGDFIGNLLKNLPEIIEWVKWGAKAVAIFLSFAIVLKSFIAVMTLVNLVMAANPVVLIVLGVMALIAAFVALVVWIDDVADSFKDMHPLLRLVLLPIEALVIAIRFLKNLFNDFPGKLDEVSESFEKMNPFVRALLGPLEAVVRLIEFINGTEIKLPAKLGAFAEGVTGGPGGAEGGIMAKIRDVTLAGLSTSMEKIGSVLASRRQPLFSSEPQIVSPQDRTARSIDEKRTSSTAEVTIRDESGRAEVTGGKLGPGLSLLNSGAF